MVNIAKKAELLNKKYEELMKFRVGIDKNWSELIHYWSGQFFDFFN